MVLVAVGAALLIGGAAVLLEINAHAPSYVCPEFGACGLGGGRAEQLVSGHLSDSSYTALQIVAIAILITGGSMTLLGIMAYARRPRP